MRRWGSRSPLQLKRGVRARERVDPKPERVPDALPSIHPSKCVLSPERAFLEGRVHKGKNTPGEELCLSDPGPAWKVRGS